MPRPIRLNAHPLEQRITPDTSPHNLLVSNFYQNWNSPTLITANDNWSGVPSVVGFLGDDTFGEGVDPRTVLTPFVSVDVIANQGIYSDLTDGGVAEFDLFGAVALQPDETADAPNLVISINTTGRSNIVISYHLRDLDVTSADAIQPVALQYRIAEMGNFINVPSGFVADATIGPNANKVTTVNAMLPSSVDNQPNVQVRFITTNAVGEDEWVGVDDIVIGSKEFATNSYTTNWQTSPSVAVAADGSAFVAWESLGQDGSNTGIYGQRFDSSGKKVGEEFKINTYTSGSQQHPSVAVDADGDAFVVWDSFGQDGSNEGVYGQRFSALGVKVGVEFQVNTYTTSHQSEPAVALNADGDALVVWASSGQDGSMSGCYGQRFSSAGTKVGGEFQLNTYTSSNQHWVSVALDADGDAFVTWSSRDQDGSDEDVYGQRFDSAGAKVGSEFRVNGFLPNEQGGSQVAVDSDGDALVVWVSSGQDGYGSGIYGQRYDPAGNKAGGEFQINTYTINDQWFPSVAVDADGDITVVWSSDGQDGSGDGIYCQRFNSTGGKVGEEFQMNTYASYDQGFSSVAVNTDGEAFVVWQSIGQGAGQVDIFAQRFSSPNPPTRFANIQINDGSTQRSKVTSLQINFDSPVSFTGNPSSAFTLINQTTTNPVTLSSNVDPTGKSVTLTFTGGSADFGSLADGRYTLTIIGNQFTGNGFDANGDGITGDNFTLVGSPANGLFRLFGDSDGNGTVNAIDFAAFRGVFGVSGPSIFDFNNDGQSNATDFAQFRGRFGVMI